MRMYNLQILSPPVCICSSLNKPDRKAALCDFAPHLLIRSRSKRSEVLSGWAVPYRPQHYRLGQIHRQQRSRDPLPDRPISSRRNSSNEPLSVTDAARATWAKTTCHSHLMITHTALTEAFEVFFVQKTVCTKCSLDFGLLL